MRFFTPLRSVQNDKNEFSVNLLTQIPINDSLKLWKVLEGYSLQQVYSIWQLVQLWDLLWHFFGWISMLIFGFAYSYLPTFAGKTLYSATLPYIHFICSNIGLIGMAGMWIGSRFPNSPVSPKLVWPFGALVILSVWLFIFNIAMTLFQ